MAGEWGRAENHRRIMAGRAHIQKNDFGKRSIIWYNIT
ncbi:hypothetical protein SXCC_01664 [Gluconacetobacter sp. SXCC-1]|nr:hypothetical protein SXCC_01664 [Gluconacetobacter sp. SXCC-1]